MCLNVDLQKNFGPNHYRLRRGGFVLLSPEDKSMALDKEWCIYPFSPKMLILQNFGDLTHCIVTTIWKGRCYREIG